MDVRDRSKDTLSLHGRAGFAAAVAARLAWFVVLEVALWSVGVTRTSCRRRSCSRPWPRSRLCR